MKSPPELLAFVQLVVFTAVLTMGGVNPVVAADDETDSHVGPAGILGKAREKYASLTSYSDEGKIVSKLNGETITTTFAIKLTRPDLYRIEWTQNAEGAGTTITSKDWAVWSAGHGDFLNMGKGAVKQKNREMALAGATGISGGAAATVPGTFFKMNWGDQFGGSASSEKQQPDEKVGDVNCYVLTNELKGRSRTLWIGKEDFLIHQVRDVTSAEAMKTTLDQAAKKMRPAAAAMAKNVPVQDVISTETHTNIVVNLKFSPEDFEH